MDTRFATPAAFLLLVASGCGGGTPTAKTADEAPTDTTAADAEAATPTSGDPAPGAADDPAKGKNSPCSGFEMDLLSALNLSACEVPNVRPGTKPNDIKDTVTVTASADSARVAPGGRADFVVTFRNKSAAPVTLDFLVDPTARFTIETFNAKTNKRVDLPVGPEPKLPQGVDPRVPGEAKTARVTLTANGVATAHVPWDASKMKWAPDKLKGTPPEMGYPKEPAGALPKGKYNIRVMTPLINVFEGIDKEISAPRTTIDVQ
jgi:hypothetical protein